MSVSYNIDSTLNGTNPDVKITLSIIGGRNPTWSTEPPDTAPAVNTRFSGGETGSPKSLFISVEDQARSTASIKVTIEFLATSYPNGVTAVNFKIFDVDAADYYTNNFVDRIFNIQGVKPNNTVVAPTSLVTSTDNAIVSANEVRGTGATNGGGGANNDALATGNVDINFAAGTAIKELSFEWSNPEVNGSQTGIQRIGLNDITFSRAAANGSVATPEMHPGLVGAAVCLLGIGFRRFRTDCPPEG